MPAVSTCSDDETDSKELSDSEYDSEPDSDVDVHMEDDVDAPCGVDLDGNEDMEWDGDDEEEEHEGEEHEGEEHEEEEHGEEDDEEEKDEDDGKQPRTMGQGGMVNSSADNVDAIVDYQPIMLPDQGQEMHKFTLRPQPPMPAPRPQTLEPCS